MTLIRAASLVLEAKIRRALGRSSKAQFPFGDVHVLHEAEQSNTTGAIFLEESARRILTCAFGVSREQELKRVSGNSATLGQTLQYKIKDAFVCGDRIYAAGEEKFFNNQVGSFKISDFDVIDVAAVSSSYVGTFFFGDWLCHDCATMVLCEERADFRFFMNTPHWPDRFVYERGFDFRFDGRSTLFCRNLFMFRDLSHNRAKIDRLRTLRKRLRERYDERASTADLVYIARTASKRDRTITNEDAVIARLESRGFQIVRTETEPDIVRRLINSRLIVSTEGSQLSHAIFALRDNSGVVVIQPPERFFNAHFDWCRMMGVPYGFTVGEANESGFSVDIDELLRIIDLVLEQTARS